MAVENREPLNLHKILDKFDTHITGLILLREALCRIIERGEDDEDATF